MILLAKSGNFSEAIAQYINCKKLLQEELDVEPSTTTTELYNSILQLRDHQSSSPIISNLKEYSSLFAMDNFWQFDQNLPLLTRDLKLLQAPGIKPSLLVRDVRFEPYNVAYLNLVDGNLLEIRCQTDHDTKSGEIIYNDGSSKKQQLEIYGTDSRFLYWRGAIRCKKDVTKLTYAFAFHSTKNEVYYFSARGIANVLDTPFYFDMTSTKRSRADVPMWAKGALLYQIFPDRFCNEDDSLNQMNVSAWGEDPTHVNFMGGDIPGIISKLDYIHELGVDILYLNPIFTSFSNHKYDTVDYYNVDPHLGGNSALDQLIKECHKRGLRIILDVSFNHCDPQFFAFKDVITHGRNSKYWDWFSIKTFPIYFKYRPQKIINTSWKDKKLSEFHSHLQRFAERTGIPYIEVDEDGPFIEPSYLTYDNNFTMPQFNFENRDVQDYFLSVAKYWITEYEIDGWRMDVPQFIPDPFWREFRKICKAAKPDCYLLCESLGDSSHWLQGDMFDASMNYLWREVALNFFALEIISAFSVKELFATIRC